MPVEKAPLRRYPGSLVGAAYPGVRLALVNFACIAFEHSPPSSITLTLSKTFCASLPFNSRQCGAECADKLGILRNKNLGSEIFFE